MDIIKALRELHAERNRLDAIIAALEAQMAASRKGGSARKPMGRRGRKSMSAAERLKVSERMTQYWESRRAQVRGQSASAATTAP